MDKELKLSGHTLKLTHLDKVLWPNEGITKGDIIEYYLDIADTILPYLKNHPMVLHRFPNGIDHPGFYQKDISKENHPEWMKTIKLKHEDKEVEYALVQNVASLIYLINLASFELHPLHFQKNKFLYPDYLIFDLDPRDISFEAIIETALMTHKILQKSGIESYCKTSGSKGLHLYVPLAGKFKQEVVKELAQTISSEVHKMLPKITSLSRSSNEHRVYIDILRNSWAQTTVAPYSVRPLPGAPVSTPLAWSEVKQGLNPKEFTIKTMRKRLDKIGDIFKPILGATNLI